MKKTIKVFGERNTGTNYLCDLLEKNLDVHVDRGVTPNWVYNLQKILPKSDECLRDLYFSLKLNRSLGWKHALLDVDKVADTVQSRDDIILISLSKSPYPWLLSMFRRPHYSRYWNRNVGKPDTLSEFVTRKWPAFKRESTRVSCFDNPVDMWNMKTQAYIDLSSKTTFYKAKYESLLADPATVISHIADLANVSFNKEGFVNIESSAKGDARSYQDYKAYYLGEKWREKINDEELKLINSLLNKSVVEAYGYKMIGND